MAREHKDVEGLVIEIIARENSLCAQIVQFNKEVKELKKEANEHKKIITEQWEDA